MYCLWCATPLQQVACGTACWYAMTATSSLLELMMMGNAMRPFFYSKSADFDHSPLPLTPPPPHPPPPMP